MVLLTDYTITHAGTSATLTNGQVTFSAVTSLSLNGCFTADFDNYVVVARGKWDGASGSANTWLRLRASGTDASGTQYTDQYLEVNGTSIGKERLTSQTQFFTGRFSSSYNTGQYMSLYGPYLAQPTAYRSVVVAQEGPKIRDDACTHSLSTSYDGLTFLTNSATGLSGALAVYGIRS
jgi:hypothetical protein